MVKIKLNDLKKAGKKLNVVLYGNKPEDHEIDVKLDEDALKKQLLNAIGELEPGEENELDHEVTQNVITGLIEEFGDPRAEEDKATSKKDKNDDLSLYEMIEEMDDLDDLKKLIKSDDTLKPLRQGIGIQKDLKKLKAEALKILSDEQTEPEVAETKTSSKDKDEEKPDKDKPKGSKSTPGYNRVDAVCEALLKKPKTIEDWVRGANEFMEQNGKTKNGSENKFIIRYIAKMDKHFDFGVKVPQLD